MNSAPGNDPGRELEALRARVRELESERNSLRQAEEALRDGEQLFRHTFDCSPVASFLLSFEGRFLSVNDALCRMLGYQSEDLLARGYLDLAHPSEHANCIQTFEDIRHARASERKAEKKFVRKDGAILWVSVNAVGVRDAAGHTLYLLATAENIHDRRMAEERLRESEEHLRSLSSELEARVLQRTAELLQANDALRASEAEHRGLLKKLGESEQRMRQVIDLVPHFIFAKDIEGKFILVNRAVADAYGTTVEGLLGRTDADFSASEEEVRHFREDDLAVIRGGVPREILEEPITDASGRVRWLATTKIPLRIAGSDRPAVLGVAIDITQRKNAESERRVLEEQLRRSQKMEAIGTLAGGIAHDFNNILTAILGYASVAQARLAGDPRGRDAVAQILAAGRRARDLVRQILTFSRQQEQERHVVALQPVIREALRLLRAAIPASVEISSRIDPGAPPVLADPTQIHQLVMNLAANAAAAIGGKPGVLEVSFGPQHEGAPAANGRPDLQAGARVQLSVRDNGRGMDAATQERIFEPFFTTRGAGGGTGLGLAVVHGIVQAHGGTISVHSQPGEGSCFTVCLPAHQPLPAAEQKTGGLLPTGSGQTILVLDDEAPIVELVRLVLEELGYRCRGYSAPDLALSALQDDAIAFDLAITDFSMPGMNGVEWARRALEVRPGLPVILVSGFASGATGIHVRESGLHCLLNKPFTNEALAEAVADALSGARKAA